LAETVDGDRVRHARESLGIPQDAAVVGSAFRMSEEKRPLLWVEAAAEVARRDGRAHFVVYGDGPMRSDMLDLARQRGIADRLHLPGPEDDIASCYKAMDVVILTSRHEGLPNVLLEAQSLGIPVVAPDVGGVSEAMLPGVTGWAVADADAAGLADRVIFCLQNADWTGRAREQAPAFVRERFGIAAMLRRTLEVYGL
jgi:glycosyltransferase involved in cell wall biosynthesis